MLGGVFAAVSHHSPAGLVIVGMAAVFAGAARVPIATLLMVAEMTGGYQLLVPAGLAVMLSFLIQINLSQFFKYGSLYEAQVLGRADSPPIMPSRFKSPSDCWTKARLLCRRRLLIFIS